MSTVRFLFTYAFFTSSHFSNKPVQYIYMCIYIYIYSKLLPSNLETNVGKIKVKIPLEQATKDQSGSRFIAVLFL